MPSSSAPGLPARRPRSTWPAAGRACFSSARRASPATSPSAAAARGGPAGRTALVGDAAGLIDPVSGDGIYEAFVSARLAAAAALDIIAGRSSDFAAYGGELRRRLAIQTTASWRAKLALERFPRLTFALLRAPLALRGIEALLRADAQEPAEIGGPGGAALRIAGGLPRLKRGSADADVTRVSAWTWTSSSRAPSRAAPQTST